MTCASCGDKGIIRLNWADAPEDYAVCLCAVGQAWRCQTNTDKPVHPLWQVWCAQTGVAPSRVYLVEEVLTPAELAERGLVAAVPSEAFRETALLNMGKTKRVRL